MRLWGRVLRRLAFGLYRQRAAVLVVLLVLASAGTYGLWVNGNSSDRSITSDAVLPIEVAVQGLVPNTGNTPGARVTLKEKSGKRRIAMSVGQTEELAIARGLGLTARVPKEQLPAAYDLLRDTIEGLGGHVDRVVVKQADASQYLAQVVVTDPVGSHNIQARPADAVALALSAKVPIYVEDSVLDKFGVTSST